MFFMVMFFLYLVNGIVRSSFPGPNPKREFRLSRSRRGSARNRLPDLFLGTQAQRPALQSFPAPTVLSDFN
jgi:hypothetical protein